MLRHTVKLALLALGLAAAAPLPAQQVTPPAPRPMRAWHAERPGSSVAANGPRRRHHRRHARRAHARNRARMRAQRGWPRN